MREQYVVVITSINDNDHVDTTSEIFPIIQDVSRYLFTFRPKRGYDVEKVIIEKDRLFI